METVPEQADQQEENKKLSQILEQLNRADVTINQIKVCEYGSTGNLS